MAPQSDMPKQSEPTCKVCGAEPAVSANGLCASCSFDEALLGIEPPPPPQPADPVTPEAALERLNQELPLAAFAHLEETASAHSGPDFHADPPARRASEFNREWRISITTAHVFVARRGPDLGQVLSDVLAAFWDAVAAKTGEAKPPKLSAPTSAEMQFQQRRRRDAS